MKLEDFKAGTFKQQYKYKSFLPEKINVEWVWEDPIINTLLQNRGQPLAFSCQ